MAKIKITNMEVVTISLKVFEHPRKNDTNYFLNNNDKHKDRKMIDSDLSSALSRFYRSVTNPVFCLLHL